MLIKLLGQKGIHKFTDLKFMIRRQCELIAIRELSNKGKLKNVVPIIEPVKMSSTLVLTIDELINNNNKAIFIVNPQVGNYLLEKIDKENIEINQEMEEKIFSSDSILIGIIVSSDFAEYVELFKHKDIDFKRIVPIFLDNNSVNEYNKYAEEFIRNSSFNIIPYDNSFRKFKTKKSIMINDRFKIQSRNKDYKHQDDEFFSNDIEYYSEDGYVGFSDFSIVGNDYQDSGFAPFAVAIHLVYKNSDGLRVHHFVSNRDKDIGDTAGKYYEALKKMIDFKKISSLDTIAMNSFKEMYKNKYYPGLGYIKKLSIMHHLELVNDCLEGKNEDMH